MNWAYRRTRLDINKKLNYFQLPDHQLAENWALAFGFCERKKKG